MQPQRDWAEHELSKPLSREQRHSTMVANTPCAEGILEEDAGGTQNLAPTHPRLSAGREQDQLVVYSHVQPKPRYKHLSEQ